AGKKGQEDTEPKKPKRLQEDVEDAEIKKQKSREMEEKAKRKTEEAMELRKKKYANGTAAVSDMNGTHREPNVVHDTKLTTREEPKAVTSSVDSKPMLSDTILPAVTTAPVTTTPVTLAEPPPPRVPNGIPVHIRPQARLISSSGPGLMPTVRPGFGLLKDSDPFRPAYEPLPLTPSRPNLSLPVAMSRSSSDDLRQAGHSPFQNPLTPTSKPMSHPQYNATFIKKPPILMSNAPSAKPSSQSDPPLAVATTARPKKPSLFPVLNRAAQARMTPIVPDPDDYPNPFGKLRQVADSETARAGTVSSFVNPLSNTASSSSSDSAYSSTSNTAFTRLQPLTLPEDLTHLLVQYHPNRHTSTTHADFPMTLPATLARSHFEAQGFEKRWCS